MMVFQKQLPPLENELIPITKQCDIKQIEVDILHFIKDVCEKNSFRYYLGYGTLLGAIRHKGFIPWDDDIDILMPRPDFERFITLMENNERYLLLSPHDAGYYYNFAKVVDSYTVLYEQDCKKIENLGIYVDIFPMDGMPTDEVGRERRRKELHKLKKKISSFGRELPAIRKNLYLYIKETVSYYLCKKQKVEDYQDRYLHEAMRFNYNNSEYTMVTGGAYGYKSIFPIEWFGDGEKGTFENEEYFIPKEFDKVLSQLYDDYMALPPENKRIPRHSFSAYYKRKL